MSPKTVGQKQTGTWSDLKTVTAFDLGSTQPVGMLDSDVIVPKIKPVSAKSLLVESLISQLCKFLEKDPKNQKKIYNEICSKLYHMKLIDKTYGVEEFEFMRNHYQKAFYHLLSVARTTSTNHNDVQKILPIFHGSNMDVILPVDYGAWDWSRYRNEFDELEFIDKGGFGSVFRAKNKLDGEEYAVKKIYLRYRNVNRFLHSLREVKMLAKLNHPNIVSYKAAWLEPLDYISGPGRKRKNRGTQFKNNTRKIILDQVSNDDDSGGIVFKNSNDDDDERDSDKENISNNALNTINVMSRKSHLRLAQKSNLEMFSPRIPDMQVSDSSKSSSEKASTGGSTESSENIDMSPANSVLSNSKIVCKFENRDQYNWNFETTISVSEQEWAILFIQMQLCNQTLRKWLDDKNAQGSFIMNTLQCVQVFQQIVQGVHYIHSKGIVHHDIKPSNVFVNSDLTEIQVGDFGLACCLQHSADDVTLMTNNLSRSCDHKGQIGTKLYAAPEQLRGKCDPKSDIYSLGIILFELLQPFSTDMERYKVINQLKVNQMPPELVARAPQLTHLITEMMDLCPSNRPSAQEVMEKLDALIGILSQDCTNENHNTALSKDNIIKKLLDTISKQQKEIEELKDRVKYLELRAANGTDS